MKWSDATTALVSIGVALLVAGCAHAPLPGSGDDAAVWVPASGTVLVVPLHGGDAQAGATVQIAYLLAERLGDRRYTAVMYDFDGPYDARTRTAVEALSSEVAIRGTVDRVHAGQVREGAGVGRLLIVDAFAHDQRWDGTSKVTRIGAAAWLVDLHSGEVWEGRAEDEGKGPYKGYSYVQRIVARRLAAAIPRLD